VELLLKMQASANIPDLRGCFPLHLAAWRGNADICRILLRQGPSVANVNAQVRKIDLFSQCNNIGHGSSDPQPVRKFLHHVTSLQDVVIIISW